MSAGTTPALEHDFAPKRNVPRYKLTVPLHLTVLRSGIPEQIPGRALEIGEGGIGLVAASQLMPGESVRVEFLLPHMTTPVRATAVVRYEHARGFGLQFLRLPVEQQSIIRYWTRGEGEVSLPDLKLQTAQTTPALEGTVVQSETLQYWENLASPQPSLGLRRWIAFGAALLVIASCLGWWRWQQAWSELEASVYASEPAAIQPAMKVAPEVMQQHIRHKVLPDYPESARQAAVQGTVVLKVVVNAEGSVSRWRVLSGPEALTQAAIDAVRWWHYEPYSVGGHAVPVETTVSVGFQLAN